LGWFLFYCFRNRSLLILGTAGLPNEPRQKLPRILTFLADRKHGMRGLSGAEAESLICSWTCSTVRRASGRQVGISGEASLSPSETWRDAIIEVENIMRRLRQYRSQLLASRTGSLWGWQERREA
jgi:hypothetical protein